MLLRICAWLFPGEMVGFMVYKRVAHYMLKIMLA